MIKRIRGGKALNRKTNTSSSEAIDRNKSINTESESQDINTYKNNSQSTGKTFSGVLEIITFFIITL